MKNKVLVIVAVVLLSACNNSVDKKSEDKKADNQNIEASIDTTSMVEPDAPLQLVKKHELLSDDLYTDYDGGKQLKDYFIIELIDKDTFVKNKPNAMEFLVADSTTHRKVNGELKLPNSKGYTTLTDNLSDNDNHKEYTFIGEIPKLKVYLISGIYWEDWDYFFVDKETGRMKQRFVNFPYLSTDEKYIICLDIDSSEGAAYIDLYHVSNQNHIDPQIGMYVKSWIPVDAIDKIYWASDNYLYIPVIHSKDYWAADGNYAGLDQYIRLKPLA